MATSQNGWPVLEYGDPRLYTWIVPAKTGEFRIRTRNGSAGFILMHFALWWAERVEPVAGKILDDWGHAVRTIRGKTSGYSNHASGTAVDLNATRWPLGTTHMPQRMMAKIRVRLRLRLYAGCLRWGGDYSGRKDQMHTEINRDLAACEKTARRLMKTKRGKRLLAANPTQKAVILS